MTPAELSTLVALLEDEEVVLALRPPLEAVCCALEGLGFQVQPMRTSGRELATGHLALRMSATFESAAEGVALRAQQTFVVGLDGVARLTFEVCDLSGDIRLHHPVLTSAVHADWAAKRHAVAVLKGELDAVNFFAPESWAPANAGVLAAQLQP